MKNFRGDPSSCHEMLCALLNDESNALIVSQTARQLIRDLDASGKDTFTIADIREAQRKIFEGERKQFAAELNSIKEGAGKA